MTEVSKYKLILQLTQAVVNGCFFYFTIYLKNFVKIIVYYKISYIFAKEITTKLFCKT